MSPPPLRISNAGSAWRRLQRRAQSLKSGADFVLIDVRGPKLYAAGHVAGAVNIPHRTITAERMAQYPKDTAFVVYCAGPHCNGANRRRSGLPTGLPVKEMIGGIAGWLDEEFALERTSRRVTAPGLDSLSPCHAFPNARM
jgi:rhodanese-related sulfurtransferase